MGNAKDSDLLGIVKCGNATGVKTLLSLGADPNAEDYRGMTALMHAAHRGYAEIVQILLDSKADPHREHAFGAPVIDIFLDSRDQISSYSERAPKALDYATQGQIKSPLDGVKETIVNYEKTIELLTKSMEE